ncbi:hypothetical protein K458DRAFT_382353 [Lentithecium fluviatile CBS 122367]|uniref:BTB domain-containing protein n=1 Tax=Lentithecium fluviatile CBS 122367 TaxID=1168545 RepID=A0A6G1JKW9_9PLEO|nr:hypothetical protein K458DRAFT_382353 [Lentithecium fluviatile CBS 122367]
MSADASNSALATKVASGALQITIANDSDFTIQLTPPAKPLVEKATNPQPKRARIVQFRCSRAVLNEHSTFLSGLFRSRPDLTIVTFENKGTGYGYALEVWLRCLHNGANTLPHNLKATHTERAWVAIGVGEQFGFAPQHIDKIKPWFLDCYNHALNNGPGLTPMTACCLAFPCSVFDHAEGFMKLTKYLAYHTNGNIFTHNPSTFQALNQDARILDGPLTTARAHIQSVLDKELFFPLDKLHRATCTCRKETAFDYQEALMALECWPVDKAVKKYPLSEIIDELEKLEFTPKATNCPSGACHHDFKNSVNIAMRKAKFAFDGLCLDCMERSQADELPRQEFLKQNYPYKGCWDMACRFGHGRASWYYSWMGSSSVRRDILAQYREEKVKLGINNRGRRGRRGRRSPQEVSAHDDPTIALDDSKVSSHESNGGSDKESTHIKLEEDIDDDDEFFDAEDAYLEETD